MLTYRHTICNWYEISNWLILTRFQQDKRYTTYNLVCTSKKLAKCESTHKQVGTSTILWATLLLLLFCNSQPYDCDPTWTWVTMWSVYLLSSMHEACLARNSLFTLVSETRWHNITLFFLWCRNVSYIILFYL